MKYYIVVIFMTMLGALASFFLKKGIDNKVQNSLCLLEVPQLYIGGFLYFSSALLNIYVLTYLPYSVVLPMTAITYVWTLFLGVVFLGERFYINKAIGVLCIILGSILISNS